jgi:hypothetical protein
VKAATLPAGEIGGAGGHRVRRWSRERPSVDAIRLIYHSVGLVVTVEPGSSLWQRGVVVVDGEW